VNKSDFDARYIDAVLREFQARKRWVN
jgi:hypothetical protein